MQEGTVKDAETDNPLLLLSFRRNTVYSSWVSINTGFFSLSSIKRVWLTLTDKKLQYFSELRHSFDLSNPLGDFNLNRTVSIIYQNVEENGEYLVKYIAESNEEERIQYLAFHDVSLLTIVLVSGRRKLVFECDDFSIRNQWINSLKNCILKSNSSSRFSFSKASTISDITESESHYSEYSESVDNVNIKEPWRRSRTLSHEDSQSEIQQYSKYISLATSHVSNLSKNNFDSSIGKEDLDVMEKGITNFNRNENIKLDECMECKLHMGKKVNEIFPLLENKFDKFTILLVKYVYFRESKTDNASSLDYFYRHIVREKGIRENIYFDWINGYDCLLNSFLYINISNLDFFDRHFDFDYSKITPLGLPLWYYSCLGSICDYYCDNKYPAVDQTTRNTQHRWFPTVNYFDENEFYAIIKDLELNTRIDDSEWISFSKDRLQKIIFFLDILTEKYDINLNNLVHKGFFTGLNVIGVILSTRVEKYNKEEKQYRSFLSILLHKRYGITLTGVESIYFNMTCLHLACSNGYDLVVYYIVKLLKGYNMKRAKYLDYLRAICKINDTMIIQPNAGNTLQFIMIKDFASEANYISPFGILCLAGESEIIKNLFCIKKFYLETLNCDKIIRILDLIYNITDHRFSGMTIRKSNELYSDSDSKSDLHLSKEKMRKYNALVCDKYIPQYCYSGEISFIKVFLQNHEDDISIFTNLYPSMISFILDQSYETRYDKNYQTLIEIFTLPSLYRITCNHTRFKVFDNTYQNFIIRKTARETNAEKEFTRKRKFGFSYKLFCDYFQNISNFRTIMTHRAIRVTCDLHNSVLVGERLNYNRYLLYIMIIVSFMCLIVHFKMRGLGSEYMRIGMLIHHVLFWTGSVLIIEKFYRENLRPYYEYKQVIRHPSYILNIFRNLVGIYFFLLFEFAMQEWFVKIFSALHIVCLISQLLQYHLVLTESAKDLFRLFVGLYQLRIWIFYYIGFVICFSIIQTLFHIDGTLEPLIISHDAVKNICYLTSLNFDQLTINTAMGNSVSPGAIFSDLYIFCSLVCNFLLLFFIILGVVNRFKKNEDFIEKVEFLLGSLILSGIMLERTEKDIDDSLMKYFNPRLPPIDYIISHLIENEKKIALVLRNEGAEGEKGGDVTNNKESISSRLLWYIEYKKSKSNNEIITVPVKLANAQGQTSLRDFLYNDSELILISQEQKIQINRED